MPKTESSSGRTRGRAKRTNVAKPEALEFDYSAAAPSSPTIVSPHLSPAKTTEVYDSYWRFAVERQQIFYRRALGRPWPWTDDPVLGAYKFTNAYRASDRVSQFLIRNVIYRDDLPADNHEIVFRSLLFKLFNKIETWQLLERSLGPISYATYRFNDYDRVLSHAMLNGERIYSAAYIMPPGGGAFGHKAKHQNHLKLLEMMMTEDLPARLADAKTMQQAFELLRAYPTIGDFLAYQFVTDINYSEVINFSEMEFVIPGPGAKDGLRKCFADPGGLSDSELIRLLADRQEDEFARLGLEFPSLWGRRLQLIDCQNLFCEIDKFARVAHPNVMGITGRTRIKQRFSATSKKMDYWYPPKWGLNGSIASGRYPNEFKSSADR
jgi:alpha-glutamyl/putrescinyl thymine pyrophosphorylase clade 1